MTQATIFWLGQAIGAGAREVTIEEYYDFGRLSHFLPRVEQSHQLFVAADWTLKHASVEVGLGGGLTPSSDHRVIKLILNKDL